MRNGQRLTARIDPDPVNCFLFQYETDYETPWSFDGLADKNCIRIRLERSGELEAYVWATWVDHHTLDFHGCSKRRLWITREVVDRLILAGELFGAKRLVTTPAGRNISAITRLFTRHGFVPTGEGTTLQLELEHYGINGFKAKETETGSSRSPAPAPAASG